MVLYFIVGCIFISYLQVVVRFGLLYSFKKKRSTCDGCHRVLKWYEIIPIVSYLFLKGKSNCCSQQISIKYLFAEILGGICGVVIGFLFEQHNYVSVIWLIFLLISTLYDIEFGIVPNSLIVLLSGYLIYLNNFNLGKFMFLLSIGVGILYSKLVKYIGGADIKIILLMLYSFELIDVLYVLLYASVIAMMFILVYGKRKIKIPFVPFLLLGYLITVIP